MSAAYETLRLTPDQLHRLVVILREIAAKKNHGTVVGLLKSEPGPSGRVRWLFDDAERLLVAMEAE